MSILIESAEISREINRVHTYALANPIKVKDITKCKIAGDDPNHVILNGTLKIVFSYEEQPLGLMRHLSVSTNSSSGYPNQIVVERILKKFGFKMNPNIPDEKIKAKVWLDEQTKSVNIVELV